jgi:hypothetical protein
LYVFDAFIFASLYAIAALSSRSSPCSPEARLNRLNISNAHPAQSTPVLLTCPLLAALQFCDASSSSDHWRSSPTEFRRYYRGPLNMINSPERSCIEETAGGRQPSQNQLEFYSFLTKNLSPLGLRFRAVSENAIYSAIMLKL